MQPFLRSVLRLDRQPRLRRDGASALRGGAGKLDASTDRRPRFPHLAQLGLGMVIKGWDEGIAQMSLGERAKVSCHRVCNPHRTLN